MNENYQKNYQYSIITILVLFLGITSYSVFNYFNRSSSTNQITVTGTHTAEIQNQIASFTINTTGEAPEKTDAERINAEKITKVKEALAPFNLDEKDIITDNYNSYRKTEFFMEGGIQKSKETDWVFTQSIRIIVRDLSTVEQIVSSINSTQSEIIGPNFTVEAKNIDETELYTKAFENAQKKASTLANTSGRTLGRVITISESPTIDYPIMPMAISTRAMVGDEKAVPAPELPIGSSKVEKTLTVIFELN